MFFLIFFLFILKLEFLILRINTIHYQFYYYRNYMLLDIFQSDLLFSIISNDETW